MERRRKQAHGGELDRLTGNGSPVHRNNEKIIIVRSGGGGFHAELNHLPGGTGGECGRCGTEGGSRGGLEGDGEGSGDSG
jgi:hypothetical protein